MYIRLHTSTGLLTEWFRQARPPEFINIEGGWYKCGFAEFLPPPSDLTISVHRACRGGEK